ncbi:MAG: hypothetical protein V4696_01230 [Pseudomonadota bacterium]
MATVIDSARVKTLAPDTFERVLAVAALALLAAMLTAIARGSSDWGQVPGLVWAHLATIAIALGLTPVMLLRRRGDDTHRTLGWIWAAAMFLTAFDTMFIRLVNRGGFSWIHLLSIWTMIQVPLIVWRARSHNVAGHRSAVRGMVTGALLIAGFFTFMFDRMLGQWLMR